MPVHHYFNKQNIITPIGSLWMTHVMYDSPISKTLPLITSLCLCLHACFLSLRKGYLLFYHFLLLFIKGHLMPDSPFLPHRLLLNPCTFMGLKDSYFVPWKSSSWFSWGPFFKSIVCFLTAYALNSDGFWTLSMLVMETFPRSDWRNFPSTVLNSWESCARLTKWRLSSLPRSSRGWGSHSSGRG